MLNQVMLIGRLGQAPKMSYTKEHLPVCSFSLATDESYTDRLNRRIQQTEWHKVIFFGKQAENCEKYLSKGMLVFVEGKLKRKRWESPDGQQHTATDIIGSVVKFLDRPDKDDPGFVEDEVVENVEMDQVPF